MTREHRMGGSREKGWSLRGEGGKSKEVGRGSRRYRRVDGGAEREAGRVSFDSPASLDLVSTKAGSEAPEPLVAGTLVLPLLFTHRQIRPG